MHEFRTYQYLSDCLRSSPGQPRCNDWVIQVKSQKGCWRNLEKTTEAEANKRIAELQQSSERLQSEFIEKIFFDACMGYLPEPEASETEASMGCKKHTQKGIIPVKKYRDKVRKRLETVMQMFADRDRVEEMIRRVSANTEMFGRGSDFKNKIDHLYMLLRDDVPALLDAFDELTKPKS